MGAKRGLDAKLYRNSGTYESPTWVEITNVKDLTLNVEKGEADVTTRANNGWEAIIAGLKNGSIDFDMVWDTSDTNFTAIQTAFFGDTQVEMLVLDGDENIAGSQGLRASMEVLKFTRNEPLKEALTVNVSLKPGYSANPPAWYTATGS